MKKILVSAFAGLVLTAGLFAQTAQEIMDKSTTLDVPLYSQCVLTMDLYGKGGKLEEGRTVAQYGNHKNNLLNTVFNFTVGAQVKGIRFLQTEKANKTDDKWIYMPSLGTVRKVNVTERKKSFVNSDVTYNDMTIRSSKDDAPEMLDANATHKGRAVWKIKLTPVANKDVEYSYRIVCVDKESYLPILYEYYDKTDTLVKTGEITEQKKVKGVTGKEFWIRWQNEYKTIKTGHSTLITVKQMVLDKELPDRYFTQNWLQTGK